MTKLKFEKEVAGYYISGHPLNRYSVEIEQFSNAGMHQIDEVIKDLHRFVGRSFKFAGLVASTEHRQTKYGKDFGVMVLTDKEGSVRLSLFGETYMKFRHLLVENTPVFVLGTVTQRGFGDSVNYELTITDMFLLDDLLDKFTRHIKLEVEIADVSSDLIKGLKSLIAKHRVERKVSGSVTKATSGTKAASDITFVVKDTSVGLSSTMPSKDTVSPSLFIHSLQQEEWAEVLEIKLSQ
jgi:DNA polymerase-3 subunit alpha